MHSDLNVRKVRIDVILEEARRTLVHAMMRGRILVVWMGDIPVDFLHTFQDDAVSSDILPRSLPFERSLTGIHLSYLPKEFLCEAGAALRNYTWMERLYRRRELAEYTGKKINMCKLSMSDYKCHDRFRVVVATTFTKKQLSSNVFNGKLGLPDSDLFEILTLSDSANSRSSFFTDRSSFASIDP
jgi:hypothetical protein